MFYEKIVLELEVFDLKDKLSVVDWELDVLRDELSNLKGEFNLKDEFISSFV